jgi:hypothetical protein
MVWILVCMLVLTACGPERATPAAPGGDAGPSDAEFGTVSARLSASAAGIASVAIGVVQNNQLVASRTLTGALGDPDAGFPLADAFFVLAPGTYTVLATAIGADGKPLDGCQEASQGVQVASGLTTEVVLTLLCQGRANGGLDTVIQASAPPLITNLTFDPNKFTRVCDPVTIGVTATDPNGGNPGALKYAWSVIAEPPQPADGGAALLPPGASAILDGRGVTAVFDTEVVGDYTLEVLVTNAAGQSASLSFPTHVLPGPDCTGSQQLGGYVIQDPTNPVIGPVPATDTIDVSVALPVSDPAGLKAFVKAVSDPNSPTYRQYLTPSQFYAQFGAADADYDALQVWASQYRLEVVATYPNKLLLSLRGAAADVERALFANLLYRQRPDGDPFVSVDREPSLALAVPILHLGGLNDVVPPQAGTVNGTGGTQRTPLYRAADIRAAYLGGAGSSCQSLDGTGEVVGIVTFAGFFPSDIVGYDALQVPPRDPTLVDVTAPNEGMGVTDNGFDETTLDIEMVQAMAPNARVFVFEGSLGLTFHADDILNKMATNDVPVSTASCSWSFGRSDHSQQALDELAAQGVSFFTASGDEGDIGDPQGNLDMDSQTLVGGTILSTNPVSPGYPGYYQSESTWNDGLPPRSKDVTGGGVMNGDNVWPLPPDGPGAGCYCIPYKSCCGSAVSIPDYQRAVDMSTNDGSTGFRNYPDVSLLADNIEYFFQGTAQPNGGTSAAAPLWAGFAALVDQASRLNGVGAAGFMNPTIYAIGLTRGTTNDLYATTFHDVADGVSNFDGFAIGKTSVPGYDLTTGWGTPTCALIQQLASSSPLTPATILTEGELEIVTGKDDLRSDSLAQVDVLFQGQTTPVTFLLKELGETWNSGTIHTFTFNLPPDLNLTPDEVTAGTGGVSKLTLRLLESPLNGSTNEDNWDVGALSLRLFSLATPVGEMCQLDMAETFPKLGNTSDPGVVRLSATVSDSGSGPTIDFPIAGPVLASDATPPLAGLPTGCAATGSGVPPSPALAEFIIATGSDTIRSDSTATLSVFGADTTAAPFLEAGIPAGGQSGDVFQTVLAVPADAPPPGQWQLVLTLNSHGLFTDHWDVGGATILTWPAGGPEQCVLTITGDPAISQLTGASAPLPANHCE